MDDSDCKHLQDIAHISETLLQILPQSENQVTLTNQCDEELFQPRLTGIDGSKDYFSESGLSQTFSLKLNEIFLEKAEILRKTCQRKIELLIPILIGQETKSHEDNANIAKKLLKVMQRFLDAQIWNVHIALAASMKTKVTAFHKDTAAASDTESSHESSVAQKGHSPRAIAILEKVFAQTTNINRSEKLQLAKATKLEPRQVTIWVSITFHIPTFVRR